MKQHWDKLIPTLPGKVKIQLEIKAKQSQEKEQEKLRLLKKMGRSTTAPAHHHSLLWQSSCSCTGARAQTRHLCPLVPAALSPTIPLHWTLRFLSTHLSLTPSGVPVSSSNKDTVPQKTSLFYSK